MKRLLFISTVLMCVFVSGCNKSNETNISSNWVGVYVDPTYSGGAPGNTSVINNIIISQSDPSILKIQLKALETSYIYTYTTLQIVTVNTATEASIDEVQGISENIGQYHIKGTVTMSGTHITLVATATSMTASKEATVQNIYFSGDKKL